ncbi:MAG: chemotaxis protein CheW [Dehalococcoidia bacterium]|nr:chemotaxis protein CheW [Dehalococcoidia bacterium]
MNHASASTPAGRQEVVAFRLADQDFCIDIDYVREIRGWTPATRLPHAPNYVKGVINLRGSVIGVIDLADRLGLGATTPSDRHVVIIVQVGRQTVGLLADFVSDILEIGEDRVSAVPDIGSDATREFIVSILTLEDGRMLRKIDLERVVPRQHSGPVERAAAAA